METADMVKVAVSAAPYSIDKPYSYLVPESLAAAAVPGVRVMVPFGRGNKESEGLILARVQEPKLPGSKAIRQILDPEPVLDKAGIDLRPRLHIVQGRHPQLLLLGKGDQSRLLHGLQRPGGGPGIIADLRCRGPSRRG